MANFNDPNNFTYTGATYAQPEARSMWQFGGESPAPRQLTKATRQYTGQGGSFSQVMPNSNFDVGNPATWNPKNDTSLGGNWQTSTGQRISDLPAFLKMREQQQTGSDFGTEQNMLTSLLQDPSKIQQTAGYQFDVDQANQAINRSAAAKGMLGSGNVLAELAKYNQGLASREYGNQVNRLSSLIGQKQDFGLQSGYYKPEIYSPTMGFGGGGSTGGGITTRTIQAPQPSPRLPQLGETYNPHADVNSPEYAQLKAAGFV